MRKKVAKSLSFVNKKTKHWNLAYQWKRMTLTQIEMCAIDRLMYTLTHTHPIRTTILSIWYDCECRRRCGARPETTFTNVQQSMTQKAFIFNFTRFPTQFNAAPFALISAEYCDIAICDQMLHQIKFILFKCIEALNEIAFAKTFRFLFYFFFVFFRFAKTLHYKLFTILFSSGKPYFLCKRFMRLKRFYGSACDLE